MRFLQSSEASLSTQRSASALSLLLFTLLATSLFAQEFSADFVSTRTKGVGTSGKVYISNGKMRYESARPSASGSQAVMIMDFAQHTTSMLMPDRHMFISYPQGRGMTIPIWRQTDVNNACAEWEVFAAQMKTESKLKSCQKTGSDTVDGRAAVKYVITSAEGKVSTVWVDPKLHTMLKHESPDGTVELKNIHEGAQPADLFEIPSGYKKLDMGSMGPSGPAPQ